MLYSVLSKQLNIAFKQQYHLKPILESLDNQTIHIQCQQPQVSAYLYFSNHHITISAKPSQLANATIIAPLTAYQSFLFHRSVKKAQLAGLTFDGELETIHNLQKLFLKFDFDAEEWLSRLVGDYPAHIISKTAKQNVSWLKDSNNRLKESIFNYLIEEKQLLPSNEEAHFLYNDIDTLSLDVERAEAKVQRLLRQASE